MNISTVILDIEGTVCPIKFVKDTLFPYFMNKVPEVLSGIQFPLSAHDGNKIVEILSKFPEDVTISSDLLYNHIKALVDNDVKDPVLKSFQGFVWELGYKNGELLAPIYEDSVKFILSNSSDKIKIYIYSSGSIKAQILLFGHVAYQGGSVDLNPSLAGYFDITTAGFKTLPTSYSKILESIGEAESPNSVLFLSDNVGEVKAALEAGMRSSVVVRPGNVPLSEEDKSSFSILTSLDYLNL